MEERLEGSQQIQQRGESSPAVSTPPMTLKEKAKYAAITGVPSLLILELLNARGPGFAIAGFIGYGAWHFSDRIRDMRPERAGHKQKTPQSFSKRAQSAIYWLGTGHAMPEQGEQNEEEGTVETTLGDMAAPATEEDALFIVKRADDTGGIARLTIDQIVSHCEPNSYKIFIGRSLTNETEGHPAVQISIYKQHFRFMGASQRGKSSMVAAFLDIVTRTHDPKHVRLVILDKEDQTGNLFAHLPHVATARGEDGKPFKLHARTNEQVLEYLIYTAAIMEYRYTQLSKKQLLEQPIVLVYLEEFLDLKNYFKHRIDKAKGEKEKEQAKRDYATFVYCIEVLSQRGLKARVQLLLCAQVEYADDDFKEALVNIQCGFSFCVRPTAAAAAGFRNTALVKRNAQENKIGQAVVETPDCNDLVLAPDYDLEQRIIAFEKAHPEIHPDSQMAEGDDAKHENGGMTGVNVNPVNDVEAHQKPVNATVNPGERSTETKEIPPAFTQSQEVQVLLAYHELSSSGEKLTRTALRDYLKWNSKQYQFILKPICDKHSILMD